MVASNQQLVRLLSKDELSVLLSAVQICARCSNADDLRSAVEGLKELIPFEYFASVYAHLDGKDISESCHIVNIDYPEEWVRLYMENRYHQVDPVVKENFSRFTIQYWADTYEKYGTDGRFISEAEDFGLCGGYTSGIRNLAGTTGGLFSFAGRNVQRSERTRLLVEAVTPHLYQALERIISADRLKKTPTLSVREKEVLKWVAVGKTTWETSVILGISDRTVKFHVNNIMKKLNAVTRTHAVAIASEFGMVDLD